MIKNIYAILIVSIIALCVFFVTKEIVSAVKTNVSNISLGTDFMFDNVSMNVGSDYSYSTIVNEDTIYNGRIVISIPITIINNKNSDYYFNPNAYYLYGPNENELNNVSKYFSNTSVDYSEVLKPNNSFVKYIYMLFDGNGQYIIRFKNQDEVININFVINK